MGSVSRIVNKILIIISFVMIVAEASLDAAARAAADGDYYFKVQKVSGEDEDQQKEPLLVEKFRALLGLRSFKQAAAARALHFSPVPSPEPSFEAESPAPAPAPAMPLAIQAHAHHHRHHPTPDHKFHKDITKEKSSRVKRVLVPVLVSTGAVFAVCVLGLIWVCCHRKKNHNKYSTRTMSVFSKKGRFKGNKSKYVMSSKRSSSTTSKVILNPSLDLFNLNSSGPDLEEQQQQSSSSCVKPIDENETTSQQQEEIMIKSESDNASSSSTREITSVHEDDDQSDGCGGDKIIPIESCHSVSDDESFHSFIDSHSSSFRLSNASAGSDVGDPPKNFSPDLDKTPHQSLLASSTSLQNETHQTLNNPDCQKNSKASPSPSPPPPPPPPPPFPQALPPTVSYSHSESSSFPAKLVSKAKCSSKLQDFSPPRDSDSFTTEPSQTPQSSLLLPQENSKPSPTSPVKPPPPCPPAPPLMKQKKSSVKGPPPPPSLLPPYTPLGKDGAPLAKLKPLHWDKVRAASDRSMVWDKLKSSSFEFDEEMIESLFGYNLQKSMKNDEAKSKTPSPSKHVLEPKRLQNITILSKALNVTSEQVCEALTRGEGLSLQQLEALVKMVPTKEEEAKLSSYKGDTNELGSAEKSVKAMLTIPFAFQRAELMLYRETFEDEVVHLRHSFSMLEEACKELRSSRLFLKLLEAVLKTGNRMNVGTIRGGAKAFKLDALLKLADVKGTDGKTTLLHFVVQEIIRSEGIRVSDSIMGKINQRNKTKTAEEKEEDYKRMGLDLVSGLSTELYNVKKTATIDLDVLACSVSNLTDGMSKLKQLLNSLSTDGKSGSNFVHSMGAFMRYAESNIKGLQEDESRVFLHVREITEYFHGDVSKEEANPLRIFVIVRDFLGMLDHVCKELRSLTVPSSPNPLAPFR